MSLEQCLLQWAGFNESVAKVADWLKSMEDRLLQLQHYEVDLEDIGQHCDQVKV